MEVRRSRAFLGLGAGLLAAAFLQACGTAPRATTEAKQESSAADSTLVQSLQKQIRDRDKRIEELESQLNALKVIDRDIEARKKSSRPPATLTPLP